VTKGLKGNQPMVWEPSARGLNRKLIVQRTNTVSRNCS